MFNARLFLGFEITPAIEKLLQKTVPQLVKVFIKPDDAYLNEVSSGGCRYLGKFADKTTDINALEQLEANIRSLLSRVFPQEIPTSFTLQLFPLIDEHEAKARK